MPPAAKIFDKGHCKLGKNIVLGPLDVTQTTVLIGGLPAVRIYDTFIGCSGRVISGDPTVLIGGRPAARVTDATIHGMIVGPGNATVNIG